MNQIEEQRPPSPPEPPVEADEYARRLRALLGRGGLGTGFPRKRRDQWIVLHAIARRFEQGETLTEIEATGRIGDFLMRLASGWEMDRATVRRALVDEGFLDRDADGRNYRRSTRHERIVTFVEPGPVASILGAEPA